MVERQFLAHWVNQLEPPDWGTLFVLALKEGPSREVILPGLMVDDEYPIA